MRYFAFATDYDGTLAHDGRVDAPTIEALERVRASGRKLIMVTGRELDDLERTFDRLDLFDSVVAENGALLYTPATRQSKILGEAPPEAFVVELQKRRVEPMSVGRVIVATWEPHHATVIETIRDLGLEMQVIFNKGAVMVLPSGINKATGLAAALAELSLSPHNAVGIGDAENDHAFLSACECAVAVSNALPAVKERVDFVTERDHGAGVTELIDKMMADDLAELEPRLTRHAIPIGTREDGSPVVLHPYGTCLLLAGSSGSGKSTAATAILERLGERGYQYCIIDPEGDYSTFEQAVVLGDHRGAPSAKEILELLEQTGQNVVANLVGMALDHRPSFFEELLPQIQVLRGHTGRPHWLVIDETHHLLAATSVSAPATIPQEFTSVIFITVHPESVAPAALSAVNVVLAIGESPEVRIADFCKALGEQPPSLKPTRLESGTALLWFRGQSNKVEQIHIAPPEGERRRHARKYAEGDLGAERSFYFRGPEGKLNLQAQNLNLFLQLAEGIDDETWLYHLRREDYSTWFREKIKDPDLAAEAAEIERAAKDSAKDSREQIKALVEERYTLPE